MSKNICSKICLFVFMLIIAVTNVKAKFEYSPISINLKTTGKQSSAVATVSNKSDENVPILIKVTKRIQQENGEELRPETNDLVAFPTQFILKPKESRTIKILWQGEEKLEQEEAYRIIVEEVPVEFKVKKADKGAVNIYLNYVGSIYVNSEDRVGEIVLEAVEQNKDKKTLELMFYNKGKGHSVLKNPTLKLKINGTDEQDITEKVKKEIDGKNILANSKLKIQIPASMFSKKIEKIEWDFKYGN